MTFPVLTAIAAGVLLLLQVWAAVGVIRLRRSLRIDIGDGGHHHVGKAIRRHGNLAENSPLWLMVFGLLEAGGLMRAVIALLVGGFVLGRCLHLYAFSIPGAGGNWRVAGMVLTFITGAVGAILLIVTSVMKGF